MRNDDGQSMPLLALVLLVMGLMCLVVITAGRAADDRARARTAADAAALAGAVDGIDGARSMAAANGATLVDYSHHGATVEVRVTVGDARATARAEASRRRVPG